jgi:hypothetical protein
MERTPGTHQKGQAARAQRRTWSEQALRAQHQDETISDSVITLAIEPAGRTR